MWLLLLPYVMQLGEVLARCLHCNIRVGQWFLCRQYAVNLRPGLHALRMSWIPCLSEALCEQQMFKSAVDLLLACSLRSTDPPIA